VIVEADWSNRLIRHGGMCNLGGEQEGGRKRRRSARRRSGNVQVTDRSRRDLQENILDSGAAHSSPADRKFGGEGRKTKTLLGNKGEPGIGEGQQTGLQNHVSVLADRNVHSSALGTSKSGKLTQKLIGWVSSSCLR